jgi:hypothetical protein
MITHGLTRRDRMYPVMKAKVYYYHVMIFIIIVEALLTVRHTNGNIQQSIPDEMMLVA